MSEDPWLIRFKRELLRQDLSQMTIDGYLADLRYFGQWLAEWHDQPVDFGTATTFDVVGHDGAYVGGVIAPGVNLSLDALHHAAAHLPRIDVTMPENVLGRNTVHCMQSGIFWGYVGLIEGLVDRIKAEDGRDLKVVATGGLASLFAEATSHIEHVDPDITLRGLVSIYHANKAARA